MDSYDSDNMSFLELLLELAELNRIEGENGSRVKIEVKNRDAMLLNFSQRVSSQMHLENFIEKCRLVKDGAARIRLLKPFFEWIPTTPDFKKKFTKRSDLSAIYAEQAQSAFHQGEYKFALESCNQALAHAPPVHHPHGNEEGRTELATALYWRALILHKLGEPSGALADLDLALTIHDFSQNQKIKTIKTVQASCRRVVEAMDDRAAGLSLEETKFNLREAAQRQQFVDDLFRLKNPNEVAPTMEDFVQIKFHPDKGRHLVAKRDVPIGTTLLVETPIVTVLDGTLKLSTMHCHHCLKKNLRRMPCPNCVFAFFCDENCLAAAHPYHQFECPCLPDLHSILDESVTDNFYLAFKLICIMGPQRMFKIFEEDRQNHGKIFPQKNKNHNSVGEDEESNFSKILDQGKDPCSGIYESQSYHSVLHLVSLDEPQEILFPLLAMMLAKILHENCPSFFAKALQPGSKSENAELETEFRDFLAAMILHHFECFWKNVFSLGTLADTIETTSPPWQRVTEGHHHHRGSLGESSASSCELEQFASALFSTTSLLNHSCDPNAKLFTRLKNGTSVIVALRPLKAGEEILISYGPLFLLDDKVERQSQLIRSYHFKCACLACRSEWEAEEEEGLLETFENVENPQFCCPKCSEKLAHDHKTPKEMTKFVLDEQSQWQCPSCGSQYDENELLDQFNQVKASAVQARQMLECGGCPLEAVDRLKTILRYFQNNLTQLSFDLMVNQETFCEAVYRIIHSTS